MTAVSAIWNQATATANQQINANPMSSTQGSGAGSTNEASISANDFLTLLVTEMKNQDPTANTDPNEYINQLVQVNSLEQLISINQNLSTALGVPATSSETGSAATPHAALMSNAISAAQPGQAANGSGPINDSGEAMSRSMSAAVGAPAGTVSGNLSVPRASAAAHRVGLALSGSR
jgi:flagellar basal-body rod modification protein FlgD